MVRSIAPLAPVRMPIRDAHACVLAEDAVAPLSLPPWDNASMDGYAVRADDVAGASRDAPVVLRVVATSAAGAPTVRVVSPGEAARIMTGAPVPGGVDSVIRVEDTDGGEATVRILSDRDALRNVRLRGEDVAEGDVVLPRGTPLQAAQLGLLASVGRRDALVHPRPRVAILASGDELVDVDRFAEVLASGGAKIVSSNSYTLEAAVREAGGIPVVLGTVRDDPVALRDTLRSALASTDCDLLVTSGGVSVGAFDFTRAVLGELGVQHHFWRVRMRPGAPVAFGVLGGTPWLGLPGNPVSALVTFELFARPAIRRLRGLARVYRRPTRVHLAEAVTIAAPLTHFLRATIAVQGDRLVATLTGPQGSGLLTSMARADALLIIPAERTRMEAGEPVDALMLSGGPDHATDPPVR